MNASEFQLPIGTQVGRYVVVEKLELPAKTEPAAVKDARVVHPIGDHVLAAVDHAGDDAEIGLETGGEDDR